MSFWSSLSVIGWSGFLRSWRVGRREALDQLAGDADDDLGRPEAGHLLGFLERDRAVVDDGGDVGDGARLHVGQALALAPDAADRAVPGGVDLEDERLGELRPDVERRAGGEGLARRRAARSGARRPSGLRVSRRGPRSRPAPAARPSRRVPLPWAISGRPPPRPSIAGIAPRDEVAGRDARGRRGRRETVTKSCGSSASRASATTPDPRARADVPRRALERVHRVVRQRRGHQANARRDLLGAARRARPASGSAAPPPGLEPAPRLAQLVLEGRDPVRHARRATARRRPPRRASSVAEPLAHAARRRRRR